MLRNYTETWIRLRRRRDPNYTDAVRGCLFVDLSVDAGVAAGRAGT